MKGPGKYTRWMDARRRHREVHSRGAPMARDACRAHMSARCMLCSGRVGYDTNWSSRGSRGPWIRYEAAAMAGRTCPFPCRTRKRSSPAAIIARRAKAARCRFFCLWEKIKYIYIKQTDQPVCFSLIRLIY